MLCVLARRWWDKGLLGSFSALVSVKLNRFFALFLGAEGWDIIIQSMHITTIHEELHTL